ncbi:MAG: phosphoribosylglycinamide formyltransferase [Bacteroidota bacterium]
MQRIAIFASGTGSNARKIVSYFEGHPDIEVTIVVSNKATAPVLEMAAENNIATLVIQRASFYETEDLIAKLIGIDLIVLAGFLWLIPTYLIRAFPDKIVNIHPALLPKYGGKGMYGKHVHQAVKAAGETESGITIHYVNEAYDEGQIIFQKSCRLAMTDEPEDIAKRVLQLEHTHFAPVIEQLLTKT